jgi:hypothetical protein
MKPNWPVSVERLLPERLTVPVTGISSKWSSEKKNYYQLKKKKTDLKE